MGAAASSVERNESAHRGRGRDAGPMGCASSRLSSEKRSAAPQDPFKAADVQDGGSSGARHCNAFRDRFECIAAVQEALADGCFAPARLTFAIDLTKSNAWSGTRSFGGAELPRSLVRSPAPTLHGAARALSAMRRRRAASPRAPRHAARGARVSVSCISSLSVFGCDLAGWR